LIRKRVQWGFDKSRVDEAIQEKFKIQKYIEIDTGKSGEKAGGWRKHTLGFSCAFRNPRLNPQCNWHTEYQGLKEIIAKTRINQTSDTTSTTM